MMFSGASLVSGFFLVLNTLLLISTRMDILEEYVLSVRRASFGKRGSPVRGSNGFEILMSSPLSPPINTLIVNLLSTSFLRIT